MSANSQVARNQSKQTFGSMYEALQPSSTISGQHFVEWFSGNSLPSYWTTTNINGTNTYAMSDSVDGGFSISTAGADSNSGTINFNNLRPFSPTGAVCISVWKKDISNAAGQSGFANTISAMYPTTECALVRNGVETNIALQTADATTSSVTQSNVAKDQTFHSYKIENGSTDIKLTIDGVFELTKTTNRPTVKLQPRIGVQKRSGAGTTVINITYCEAYNT